jgi:hypothetical protein
VEAELSSATAADFAGIVFLVVVLVAFVYNIFGLSIPRLKNAGRAALDVSRLRWLRGHANYADEAQSRCLTTADFELANFRLSE